MRAAIDHSQAKVSGTVRLMTDSIVELEVLPDRIDPDGTPWLSPGITQAMSKASVEPFSTMPIAL